MLIMDVSPCSSQDPGWAVSSLFSGHPVALSLPSQPGVPSPDPIQPCPLSFLSHSLCPVPPSLSPVPLQLSRSPSGRSFKVSPESSPLQVSTPALLGHWENNFPLQVGPGVCWHRSCCWELPVPREPPGAPLLPHSITAEPWAASEVPPVSQTLSHTTAPLAVLPKGGWDPELAHPSLEHSLSQGDLVITKVCLPQGSRNLEKASECSHCPALPRPPLSLSPSATSTRFLNIFKDT